MDFTTFLNRRAFLKTAGLLALSHPLLTACSSTPGSANSEFEFDPRSVSPIDRDLPVDFMSKFSGEDPTRAHALLRDKDHWLAARLASVQDAGEFEVIVVGGGMSGLLSSYLLRDLNTLVLEQGERFGGNAKGESWQGMDYSVGAAYLLEPDEGTRLHELFVEDLKIGELCRPDHEELTGVDGVLEENFWKTKGRHAGAQQASRLNAYLVGRLNGEGEKGYPEIPLPEGVSSGWIKELDRSTLHAHLEKALGEKLKPHVRQAVEFYCWSAFGASATEISAASGLNFLCAEFGKLMAPKGGNASLAERLVERLGRSLPRQNLRSQCTVLEVRPTDHGADVLYVDRAKTLWKARARKVVMSCPKFVAANIIPSLDGAKKDAISKLRYRSYVVANVLYEGTIPRKFYNLPILSKRSRRPGRTRELSSRQGVTDLVSAAFAMPGIGNSVLTLYRPLPYEGGRAEMLDPTYERRLLKDLEKQIDSEILPMLKLDRNKVKGVRLWRWGHPLPVAAAGLIADGTTERLRAPLGSRIFFVQQDNYALPALETCAHEALHWTNELRRA